MQLQQSISQSINQSINQTGDVAQWLVRQNSNPKTLGSIPWRGRVRDNVSVPPGQLMCRITPFVCTERTQICAHVKAPTSICRKRVGLTTGGMVTQKYYRYMVARLSQLAFPKESDQNVPWEKFPLEQ